MEWSKVAGDLTKLTKQIGDARRTVEREPRGKDQARRVVVNRALATTEGLRSTLRDWFSFYDGYDPLFTWWMEEPYKAADGAIDAYAGCSARSSEPSSAAPATMLGLFPADDVAAAVPAPDRPASAKKLRRRPIAPTQLPRGRVKSSATRSAAMRFSPSSSTR